MATKRKKKADNGDPYQGQTAQEIVDSLRKEAHRIENQRYDPNVRRAMRWNPKVAGYLEEMESVAAQYRKIADDFELNFGHFSDEEFAAIQARADELAREHPEMLEQARRDAEKTPDEKQN